MFDSASRKVDRCSAFGYSLYAMIQFYFLSIVLNFLAGYAVSMDSESSTGSLEGIRELFRDETLRLVLGILAMSVGFFKLLTVVRGDVPVVGDLIPAVAGLSSGFTLAFEFYRSRSTIHSDTSERLESIFLKNRKWLGIAAIVSSAAHFLFPTVLFL